MIRISLAGVVVAAALAVGCATFQKGETVVKYEKGATPRMAEAPTDGRYALYSGTDLRNAQIQYSLKKGEKLGFTERDGQIYAVAGDNEQMIETGTITKSFFWRKLSEASD